MTMPIVSVVMPVRNARAYIDESIASILSQSFRNFEFVILDDASTDGSSARIREWAQRDQRILHFQSTHRLGPTQSSQAVVEHSSGAFVARMDADDVAHSERLARQVELFEAEPEAGLVGTLHRVIDEAGRELRALERWPLLRALPAPPIAHDSIMFRRNVFDRVGGYRTGCDYWEDIDLLARFAQASAIYIIPEALMTIRFSADGTRFNANQYALDRAYQRMTAQRAGLNVRKRGRPSPEAFLLSGAPRLWAGHRPNILRRLLRSGALGLDRKSAAVLVWALWAEAEPASLRLALRIRGRILERRWRATGAETRWLRWRPAGQAREGAHGRV